MWYFLEKTAIEIHNISTEIISDHTSIVKPLLQNFVYLVKFENIMHIILNT